MSPKLIPRSSLTTSCCTRSLGPATRSASQKCCNYIIRHQNEDGGWPIYEGGPSNISASVKAYFGLKLTGYSPDHPVLAKARAKILEMGGVTGVNTFTKIYLCFLGQYDYDAVPAIPPEIVLFPKWFWFEHLRDFVVVSRDTWCRCRSATPGSRSRKFLMIWALQELYVGGRDTASPAPTLGQESGLVAEFFLVLDRVTHWFESSPQITSTTDCPKSAKKWMLERFEMSDGLGAIYPSMLNAIIALRCLGYSVDDPQLIRAMDEFEKAGN